MFNRNDLSWNFWRIITTHSISEMIRFARECCGNLLEFHSQREIDQKIDAYRSLLQIPFEFSAARLTFAHAELSEWVENVIGGVESLVFFQNRQQLDISMTFAEVKLRNSK
jgi:hypothetical protein